MQYTVFAAHAAPEFEVWLTNREKLATYYKAFRCSQRVSQRDWQQHREKHHPTRIVQLFTTSDKLRFDCKHGTTLEIYDKCWASERGLRPIQCLFLRETPAAFSNNNSCDNAGYKHHFRSSAKL